MLAEISPGIQSTIETRLDWLVKNNILSGQSLGNAIKAQKIEFALRFPEIINRRQIFIPDIPKIRTLFHYCPERQQFIPPSKNRIIAAIQDVLPSILEEYPNLEGLLFFGSRSSGYKKPRNTLDQPSDIDIIPIMKNNPEGRIFGKRGLHSIERYISLRLNSIDSIFSNIPIQCSSVETIDSFFRELNPDLLRRKKSIFNTTFWSKDPTAPVYIGNPLMLNQQELTSAMVNHTLHKILSCDKYNNLRIAEINERYWQLN